MCSYIYSREPNETKVAQACVEDDACVRRESGACTKNDNYIGKSVCVQKKVYKKKNVFSLSFIKIKFIHIIIIILTILYN